MEDHSTKRKGIVETPTYWRLEKDPTAAQENRLSRKMKQLEKRYHGHFVQSTRLSGRQPPRIYGLCKIRKTEFTLRPIVLCIGSTSYQLYRWVLLYLMFCLTIQKGQLLSLHAH